MLRGVPVVWPSKMPDRIFTRSDSRRWVVKRDWPGRRRSSQGWMSASDRGMRGGTPSTTQPMAGPWLSPQVVKRKRWPKLLKDISGLRVESLQELGDLGRRFGSEHADDVIAAVDMMDFPGDSRGQVAEEVQAGAAHLVRGDVTLQWRIQLVPLEDVAEVADAGGRQSLDWAGGDGVDANVLPAEVGGHVAHARLECRFGHAHDVVVGHHPFGTVIGEGEQAAAVRHQLDRALRDCGEGVARNVEREGEVLARRVDVFALQLVLVREGNGVDDEIKPAPALVDSSEHGVDAGVVHDVAGYDEIDADRLCQRRNPLAESVTLIGEGQLGPRGGNSARNAPGDRPLVRDAHDEAALAGHQPALLTHQITAGTRKFQGTSASYTNPSEGQTKGAQGR